MTRLPLLARVRDTIVASLSRRTSLLLGGLIILLSSTQLGLHFWPASALVYGIRLDYLSPTLYLLDLLIFLFLCISRGSLRKIYLVPVPVLLAGLIFSASSPATLFWSLRLLLYLAFMSVLTTQNLAKLSRLLPWTMLAELLLGVSQMREGHSLQGIFYWFGERFFSVSTPLVATSQLFGELWLRPYGTFSHPNILAGWLVVCLLIIINLPTPKRPSSLYLLVCTLLCVCGVILTGSRSAALSLFGIIIPFCLLPSPRLRLPYFIVLICGLYFVFTTGFATRDLWLSVSERLLLLRSSLRLVFYSPFFGSGALASPALYPTISPGSKLLQPDHFSPTLILSWFGLFGLAAFLLVIPRLKQVLLALIPLSPILILDHYLFTSPQGLFILILYLHVTIAKR